MDPLERGLRFIWSIGDACADETVAVPLGTVLRTPSLPHAWSVNALRIERPAPDLTLADAEAAAAAHAVAGYRHLLVEDETTALRLLDAAGREPRGWTTDCELVMRLVDDPDPGGGAAGAAVREGRFEEILELFTAWLEEEEHARETVEDLVERRRREHAAGPERLVVAEHEGRPAAMCSVRLGGDVAQLEDVYVLPAARGTGLGRAVTAEGARIAAESGAGLVVIVADDRDWPKQLYANVGFAPLGRRAILHRAA